MNNFNYTNLPPFKWFVLENFPYIEADFDALTNWELFCKLGEEINKVIDKMNLCGEQTEDLTKAFNELKNYINNYFENLDVQNEINKKLDEMVENGSLQILLNNQYINLVNEVNTKINENQKLNNYNFNELNNKINNINSGNPLKANSLDEMIDTSKIYILTTNGHWYYFNNEQWNDGGVYQGVEIGDNSIKLQQLEPNLQENFNSFFKNVNYNTPFQGFIRVSRDLSSYEVVNNSDYKYGTYNLEKGKKYYLCGFNSYESTGLTIINNGIIKASSRKSTTTNPLLNVTLIYECDDNNDVLYISKPSENNSRYSDYTENGSLILEIDEIDLNYTKKLNNLESVKTINNCWANRSVEIGSLIDIVSNDKKSILEIYKINKGINYILHFENLYNVASIIITDNNLNVLYKSSNSNKTSWDIGNDLYESNNDGYCFISKYNGQNHQGSPYILLDNNSDGNKYKNKKWCAVGDSLSTNITNPNYIDNITNSLNLNTTVISAGGDGYYHIGGTSNFVTKVQNIPQDTDIITIFGSFNDVAGEIANFDEIIGDVTDTETNTICGCINTTLDWIMNNRQNAVLGVILPTPWKNRNPLNRESNIYINKLIEICKNKSIPYLDLFHKSNLYPWIESFNNNFFNNGDGTHPNINGHKKISGMIEAFIKELYF